MERAHSFASFTKVRQAILDIRTQSDSTAHPGSSLTATTTLSNPFWNSKQRLALPLRNPTTRRGDVSASRRLAELAGLARTFEKPVNGEQ